RHDWEAVLATLRRGERPDLATTMACGRLDELVALHDEPGVLRALNWLRPCRPTDCCSRSSKGWPAAACSAGPGTAPRGRWQGTSGGSWRWRRGLTSWDGITQAAAAHGAPGGCLVHQIGPEAEGLVSTRSWPDGFQALLAYRRPRWHIEDDGYRELTEGWSLEAQRWSRDAAARGR